MAKGWESFVIGPTGFVGHANITKGGIFDAKTGKRWASANFKVNHGSLSNQKNINDFSLKGHAGRGCEPKSRSIKFNKSPKIRLDPWWHKISFTTE
jgi:hypothetical protein